MSSKSESMTFDIAVRKLLLIAMDIKSAIVDHYKQHEPKWSICAGKFYSCYTKLNDVSAFKPMFVQFYKKYQKEINTPIFDDETVNDAWLKCGSDIKIAPKSHSTSSKGSNWLKSAQQPCSGIVIIYNQDYPMVSIPISEIYNQAIKVSNDHGEKNSRYQRFPAEVLYSLFWICKTSSDDNSTDLDHNLDLLKKFIDEMSPSETPSNVGSSFDGIGSILKKIMASSGMGNSINEKSVDSAVSTLLNGDTTKKMGEVVTNLFKDMQDAKPTNINDALDKFGDVLKKPEMKELIAETAKSVSNISGVPLEAQIPNANNIPSHVNNDDSNIAAEEQS